jgi:hypothetical protein
MDPLSSQAIKALYVAIEKLPHAGMHNECCGEMHTQLALLIKSSDLAVVAALREMACKVKDELIQVTLRAVANTVFLNSGPRNRHP